MIRLPSEWERIHTSKTRGDQKRLLKYILRDARLYMLHNSQTLGPISSRPWSMNTN